MDTPEKSIVPITHLMVVTPSLLTIFIGIALGFVPYEAAMLILLVVIATFLSTLYLKKPLMKLLSLNHVSVKVFHIMYGSFILLLGTLYGRYTVLTSILACLIFYGLYEYLYWSRREDVPYITEALKLLGISDEYESKPFLCPIYASLGIFITSTFFTSQIAMAAISVLVLGDGFAALMGRVFGRHPLIINRQKTIEGSLTGLFMGFVGCQLFIPAKLAIIGSITGMLMEAIPIPLNDNLTVPVFSAFCMALVYNLIGF